VAGIGHMKFARFQLHNTVGGVTWVGLFVWGGYLFGNLSLIRENFGIVTLLIIVVSLIPVALSFRKGQPSAAK
jgi:membrane-associated protein